MRNPLYRLLVICLIVAPLVHQARAASRMVGVIVELNDTPAVVVFATGRPHGVRAAQTAARKTLSAIGREQDRITTELSNLDGIVLARMQRAYNGLIVLIPERRIAAVRALRGVRSVHFCGSSQPQQCTERAFDWSTSSMDLCEWLDRTRTENRDRRHRDRLYPRGLRGIGDTGSVRCCSR